MTWPPVLLDCAGQPESAVTYRGIEGGIGIIGTILQEDGSLAPVYGLAPEIEAFRTAETSNPYMLPDPLPGEVSYVHVESTDAAGNRSEDCHG